MFEIGLIGCGRRLSGLVKALHALEPETRFTVADPDREGARWRMRQRGFDTDDIRFVPDAEALMEHADKLDGIMIGTRCKDHAPAAVTVAPADLPLFLEKPVAISFEQLEELADAYRGSENKVVVSFPLRVTPIFRAALEIVRSGRLGTINQIQAVNNVPYGGTYFANWYRNYEDAGGLWLQKATHDLDYVNVLAECAPTMIAAVMTRKIYGGDMPHDLRCSECDRQAECPESAVNLARRGDAGGMNWASFDKSELDHLCPFSREIKSQDSGSALVLYEDGMHACYSQNFVTRRSAGRRGATITGYTATLDFDFHAETIRVVDHHANRIDRIEVKAAGGHGGGDGQLLMEYLDLVRDGKPARSNLKAGLLSAAMCLAARESCATRAFQEIPRI